MESIANILKQPQKATQAPQSEHQEQLLALLAFMGEDESRYRYWCGRTSGVSPQQLFRLMKQAEGGKPPQKLFNWLLKEFKKKA